MNPAKGGAGVVRAFFGARYYTPEAARFTQVDPLTLSLGTMRPAELNRILSDPQRYLHPYAYAANNPLKYVDQNGQFPILVPLAAMAVALGGAVWAMPDVARSGYYAVTGDYAAAGESSDRALAKEAIAFAVLGTAIASAEAFVGAAAANQSARQATAPQAQTTGAIAQNRLRFAPGVDTHISQGRINSQGTIVGGHMWNQEAEELVQRVNGTVRIGSNGVRVAQYSDMNGNLRVKTYLPDWFTDRDAAVVKAQLLTQAPQGNNVVTQYRGIQFRGLVSDNQINSWYPVNPLPR